MHHPSVIHYWWIPIHFSVFFIKVLLLCIYIYFLFVYFDIYRHLWAFFGPCPIFSVFSYLWVLLEHNPCKYYRTTVRALSQPTTYEISSSLSLHCLVDFLFVRCTEKEVPEENYKWFCNFRDTRDRYTLDPYGPYERRQAPPPPSISSSAGRIPLVPSRSGSGAVLFDGIADGQCSELLKSLVSNLNPQTQRLIKLGLCTMLCITEALIAISVVLGTFSG